MQQHSIKDDPFNTATIQETDLTQAGHASKCGLIADMAFYLSGMRYFDLQVIMPMIGIIRKRHVCEGFKQILSLRGEGGHVTLYQIPMLTMHVIQEANHR